MLTHPACLSHWPDSFLLLCLRFAACFMMLYTLHELFLKTLMILLQGWLIGVEDFIVIVLLVAAMRALMEKIGQQVQLHHRINADCRLKGFNVYNSEKNAFMLYWSLKPGQIYKTLSSTPSQQSSSLNNSGSRPGPARKPRGKSNCICIKTYARCKFRLMVVGNCRTVSWGRFSPQHIGLLLWSPWQHRMSSRFSRLQPPHI